VLRSSSYGYERGEIHRIAVSPPQERKRRSSSTKGHRAMGLRGDIPGKKGDREGNFSLEGKDRKRKDILRRGDPLREKDAFLSSEEKNYYSSALRKTEEIYC